MSNEYDNWEVILLKNTVQFLVHEFKFYCYLVYGCLFDNNTIFPFSNLFQLFVFVLSLFVLTTRI